MGDNETPESLIAVNLRMISHVGIIDAKKTYYATILKKMFLFTKSIYISVFIVKFAS